MRQKIIAGNWKMYKTLAEAETTLAGIANELTHINTKQAIYIAPPFTYLEKLKDRFGNTGIKFGAQNMHAGEEGAFTGEISGKMLESIGCHFVLLGHSERREYFGETDVAIREKIKSSLKHHLQVIYCCGEKLEDRKSGNHFGKVEKQIKDALFHLSGADFEHLVIAYEPVWAIGTGVNASPEQAQEMHAFIRSLLLEKFGGACAEAMRILYGGSVKPGNAQELFSMPGIDGGLIGGASLQADDFMKIIQAS